MKEIAIQHCKTLQFFTDGESWTPEFKRARQFASSREALMFALARKLADVQIVLRFGNAASDVVLPITDGCRGGDHPQLAA